MLLHWLFGENSLWCRTFGRLFGCYRKRITLDICSDSGCIANVWCPRVKRVVFKKGNEPKEVCVIHYGVKIRICLASKRRATKWCPKTEVREYRVGDEPTEFCSIHKQRQVNRTICLDSLLRATKCCLRTENRTFVKGEEPTHYCTEHHKVEITVCKETGLKANQYCPDTVTQTVCNTAIPAVCTVHKKPPPPPEPPKLIVKDGTLYFGNGGTQKFMGFGVSRREALHRKIGINGYTWDDCKVGKYSLEWYRREIVKYKLNYVRHDSVPVKHLGLLEEDIRWAYKNGIVYEVTLRDGDRPLGDPIETAKRIKDYANVILEVWNEMYSLEDVEEAVALAKKLKEMGVRIISGGAIGAGGAEWAEEFFKRNPPIDIIQVHRHWPMPNYEDNDWVLKYVGLAKPVGRNEFFDMKKLGLEKTRFIMEKTIEHGAQLVNYYGFRMGDLFTPDCGDPVKDGDGNPYYEYLKAMREVKEKYGF